VIDTFAGAGNISDVVISNCYLHSRQANALRLLIEAASQGFPTISRVAVSNIVAKAGVQGSTTSGGITIRDEKQENLIVNVEIDGFHLDASQSFVEPLVVEWATRVHLARVFIDIPRLRSRIAGCHSVSLIECVINGPRESGQQCLLIGQPVDPEAIGTA
jgi:hypothetical protein